MYATRSSRGVQDLSCAALSAGGEPGGVDAAVVGDEEKGHQIRGGKKLVGARGFEPPTPGPPVLCATGLRHAPTSPNQVFGQTDSITAGQDVRSNVPASLRALSSDSCPRD